MDDSKNIFDTERDSSDLNTYETNKYSPDLSACETEHKIGKDFSEAETEMILHWEWENFEDTESARLKEPEVAYGRHKRQGEYTIEDYYALPDDVRAELIDGELYLMAAPSLKHQWILGQLSAIFIMYIKSKNGKCLFFPAPLDIQLDRDDWTMLQPDLTILCDRDKARENKIYGAPDFVTEILSPSTRLKEKNIKLRKYREAGVRECWLIDPEKETIEVYLFRNPDLDVLPRVYTFDDVVPVGIYNGDCKVDFPDLFRGSPWPREENI